MDAPQNSEPVTDPVADLPASDEADFASSIDNSLAKAFAAVEKATDLDSAEPVEDAEVAPEDQPAQEEADAIESGLEENDPIEDLEGEIGDDWTSKASAAFVRVKSQLKEARAELEPLQQFKEQAEARIKELEGLAEGKDAESLLEKLKAYEDQQMLQNLEATEAYKKAVDEPLSALLAQAEEMADKYDIDSRALIDVLAIPDSETQEEQLSELLPNASIRDKAKIFNIAEQIDPIAKRREELFANKEQALAEAKQLEEQRELAAAAERAQLRQNVTRNVVERVQQKLPFLKGMEGLDLETIQSSVSEVDPTTLHPVDHAYNSVSSKILPPLVRAHLSLQKEFESVLARLAEYEEAEPSNSSSSATDSTKPSPDSSFEERVNAQLAGL